MIPQRSLGRISLPASVSILAYLLYKNDFNLLMKSFVVQNHYHEYESFNRIRGMDDPL